MIVARWRKCRRAFFHPTQLAPPKLDTENATARHKKITPVYNKAQNLELMKRIPKTETRNFGIKGIRFGV